MFFSNINTLDKQKTVMPFNEAVKLSVPEFKSVPGNGMPKNVIFGFLSFLSATAND